MMKTILSFIGGFVIGFLIVWAWNTYMGRSNLDVPATTTAPDGIVAQESGASGAVTNESVEEAVESTNIDVRDQLAGERTNVAAVTLSVDGWIVVHEENNSLVGNALGAVRRDAGAHQSVEIPLLRATEAGSRYWIVLYSDNGDRLFGLEEDFPLRDEAGNPITKSFMAQ